MSEFCKRRDKLKGSSQIRDDPRFGVIKEKALNLAHPFPLETDEQG